MNNTPSARFDLTFIVLGIQNLSTIKPQNFVEIGSRDGYDTNFASNHFSIKHENCFVFEPNPQSCRDIMQNYPNFNTFNNAISSQTGTFDFYIDKDNIGCCSLLKNFEKSLHAISVDCIDMKSVITNFNLQSIDICKIDVEGATLDVIKSFDDKLGIVKSIQLEADTEVVWENQSFYSEIKKHLDENNFTEVLFCRLGDSQVETFWIANKYLK